MWSCWKMTVVERTGWRGGGGAVGHQRPGPQGKSSECALAVVHTYGTVCAGKVEVGACMGWDVIRGLNM